jgi:mRNA interferase MazF
VLSRDVVNEHRRTVLVVPLSSSPSAHPPIRVAVNCDGKLGVAVVDQLRAIAKQRLRKRIGIVNEQEIEAISEALRQILDLM